MTATLALLALIQAARDAVDELVIAISVHTTLDPEERPRARDNYSLLECRRESTAAERAIVAAHAAAVERVTLHPSGANRSLVKALDDAHAALLAASEAATGRTRYKPRARRLEAMDRCVLVVGKLAQARRLTRTLMSMEAGPG